MLKSIKKLTKDKFMHYIIFLMMGLNVMLYNCVSLYNDKVIYLESDLTIYSSVSNDAQHLPLHIRMVTHFLP